jgi:hypothetical protein
MVARNGQRRVFSIGNSNNDVDYGDNMLGVDTKSRIGGVGDPLLHGSVFIPNGVHAAELNRQGGEAKNSEISKIEALLDKEAGYGE